MLIVVAVLMLMDTHDLHCWIFGDHPGMTIQFSTKHVIIVSWGLGRFWVFYFIL